MKPKPPKNNQNNKGITANITPALQFDASGVVENHVAMARGRGLMAHVKIKAIKELRGIRKGSKGTIVEVGKEISVLWEMGSLIDESDADSPMTEPIMITMNAIAPLTKEELT